MAAGITDHGWRVHELLSSHVPPPPWTPPKRRGRPSHALKRITKRWCGNHGYLWSYQKSYTPSEFNFVSEEWTAGAWASPFGTRTNTEGVLVFSFRSEHS